MFRRYRLSRWHHLFDREIFMSAHTVTQQRADKLDLDTDRIMRRLEEYIADSRGDERRKWSEARLALSTARGHIRSMMSDEDRRATA